MINNFFRLFVFPSILLILLTSCSKVFVLKESEKIFVEVVKDIAEEDIGNSKQK